jgi:hypothetical protein
MESVVRGGALEGRPSKLVAQARFAAPFQSEHIGIARFSSAAQAFHRFRVVLKLVELGISQ